MVKTIKKSATPAKKEKDPRNTGVSAKNLTLDARESRKGFDAVWHDAAHAPMFCRSKEVTDSEGETKVVRRTARLIPTASFKIAASGAALNAKSTLSKECMDVRVNPRSEIKRNPWLPSISNGACIMLEQFVCAVAQEAAQRAHIYRLGSGNTMRINKSFTRMGWNATMESVFASTMPCAKTIYVVPMAPRKKKSAKVKQAEAEDDGEYTPPDEDEQNPSTQGDEEDIAGGD